MLLVLACVDGWVDTLDFWLMVQGHSVAGDTWEDVLRHLRRSYPILILFDNCERIHKRVRVRIEFVL